MTTRIKATASAKEFLVYLPCLTALHTLIPCVTIFSSIILPTPGAWLQPAQNYPHQFLHKSLMHKKLDNFLLSFPISLKIGNPSI